jgi:chemotaxis protein MotB
MSTFSSRLLILPMVSALALTGCVSQSKYDALQTQYNDSQSQLAAANAKLAAADAQVSRLQGAIKYVVNSDLLFPPGGYELSAAGKKVIGQYVKKLGAQATSKIVVAGYTDNAPVGEGLIAKGITSNQILSQKRAENVASFIVSQGMKADMVSAVGKGDTDPVAPNTTANGRAKNRRVEISVAK